MKKLLAILLVLVMIMSVACSKGDNKDNTPTSTPEPTVTATPEPTKEPTAVPTEAPTEAPTEEPTPEPTEEPTPTEEPGDGTIDAGTLYSDNYEDFTGTWYLNRGEVEGEEWTPDDVEEYLFINFLSDLTAERVRELSDAPEEVQHGVVTYGRTDDGKAWVSVDYKDEDCSYSYILNDEGELEEHIDYEYIDGTNVSAALWYCRTPFWGGEGDPQVWKEIPP